MDRGPQIVEGTRLCVKLNYKFVCVCFILMYKINWIHCMEMGGSPEDSLFTIEQERIEETQIF